MTFAKVKFKIFALVKMNFNARREILDGQTLSKRRQKKFDLRTALDDERNAQQSILKPQNIVAPNMNEKMDAFLSRGDLFHLKKGRSNRVELARLKTQEHLFVDESIKQQGNKDAFEKASTSQEKNTPGYGNKLKTYDDVISKADLFAKYREFEQEIGKTFSREKLIFAVKERFLDQKKDLSVSEKIHIEKLINNKQTSIVGLSHALVETLHHPDEVTNIEDVKSLITDFKNRSNDEKTNIFQ